MNIINKVKTFEDALGIKGKPLSEVFSMHDSKDEIAYKKLKIIAEALNEGWQPDWKNDDEVKYFPWFNMSGSSLAFLDYVCDFSASHVGSRLCFKSWELAEYAATQFIEIYSDFFTI